MQFKDNLEETVSTHCFGSAVHAIPIDHANAGAMLTVANLLVEPYLIPLERVINVAQKV